jgi:3-phenylpropionate/cinnamic acid dioxygenase small subunit
MSDPMSDGQSEIVRRLYEYALGIDTRDWALYRSIFTEELAIDFSSFDGRPAARMPADDWVAACSLVFTGLDATQHVMSNPIVDLDGDRARCRMYMKAEHFLKNDQGDDAFALGGYYDDRLIRSAEGWRIESVTLNVFWNRGNRHIMQLAAAIGQRRLSEQ